MKKNFINLILVFVSFPFLVNAQTSSIPPFPMAFWGKVTVNNNPAPAGCIIRAYYGSILAGQVTLIEDGIYGYTEPTKQKLVVGEGSGPITFTIQCPTINAGNEIYSSETQSYSGFTSGLTVQKDFMFTIPSSLPSNSGGGSVYIQNQSPTTSSEATSKSDINGDGKVDKYDFAIMMSEWGQVGSNLSADLNHDGKIDKYDFAIMMSQWGL